MARPIITLTTDFGLADVYAAAMKGVILGINPDAAIVDITHEVPPQDVRAGAYALDAAWDAFPPGTVHVAIVDPGVGTDRLPIAARGPGATFVGPDNGTLSYALGPRLTHVTAFAVPVAVESAGRVEGCVQHVDRYGNLVTNIAEALLSAAGGGLTVEVGSREVVGLSGSFPGDGPLVAVIGSGGWLEIAVPNGSAARELGAGIGDAVAVRLGPR